MSVNTVLLKYKYILSTKPRIQGSLGKLNKTLRIIIFTYVWTCAVQTLTKSVSNETRLNKL